MTKILALPAKQYDELKVYVQTTKDTTLGTLKKKFRDEAARVMHKLVDRDPANKVPDNLIDDGAPHTIRCNRAYLVLRLALLTFSFREKPKQ